MSGTTVTASSTTTYYLGASVTNPVTIAPGVTISVLNNPAVGSLLSTYWTIVNYGTLVNTGPNGYADGVVLAGGGGLVTNMNQGSIAGYNFGVSIAGSGSVANYGTISTENVAGTGFNNPPSTGFTATTAGVLMGGGAVYNGQHGLIDSYFEGVVVGAAGTVVNLGTISAPDTLHGYGVVLTAGGTVINQQTGTITSGSLGIVSLREPATVYNAGLIYSTNAAGVGLLAGGVLTNTATGAISGDSDGVAADGAIASTIVNSGFIYGYLSSGAFLNDGGSVTNSGTGLIDGYYFGVQFGAAGSVVNSAAIVSTAKLSKANQSTFSSAGVQLMDGGAVTNTGPGAIVSRYLGIQAFNAAATVFNTGTITTATTLAGTIQPTFSSAGVQLVAGGSVTNAGTGSIFGMDYGVQILNAPGSSFNAGTISDSVLFGGAGVQLADGGVVTNAAGGHISSMWMGVQIGASLNASVSGTVINYGTIHAADKYGDGAGVWIHGPASITNASGGVISGGGFGIVTYFQTTLVNQGTVFGTEFAFDATAPGFADRVVDMPGGVFSGTVTGGNTFGSAISSTLELATGSSVGTISNLGTFIDFAHIALDAGATWSVGGSIVAGETVAFGASHASLILTSPSHAAGGIMSSFVSTDTIVLAGITDVSGLHFGAGDVLTVSQTSSPGLTLHFDAQPDLGYMVVDGSTDIYVACFLPGTTILTNHGEIAVEKLSVGDTIVTLNGTKRRLCWIGHGRTLATRGRRNAATPVIVRKGALADNIPHHDLHITKGHSLYLDGVLIPVEFLVNHRTILWDDRAQEITVYHLELDVHDVLLANGAPAESYRDDGNRWLFQNANEGWDLAPQPACAPVLTGGSLVDAVWQRLLDRAGPRPGVPLTNDPDLHLLVDGQRVAAHEVQGPVHVFGLDGRPASVRIVSREAVPAELGLSRDARSLGVALRHIAVRQGNRFVVLRADDAQLKDGFYRYEAAEHLRWTNGSAALPAEVFSRFAGVVEVVLHLAATTQYPLFGDSAARAA